MRAASTARLIRPSPATTKNGIRQVVAFPSQEPKGTPATRARVRPRSIVEIAEPTFSLGTEEATMVVPMANETPWATAISTRAVMSSAKFGASAAPMLAT